MTKGLKNAIAFHHRRSPRLIAKASLSAKETTVKPKYATTERNSLPSIREKHYLSENYDIVIGVDEAGRGPLAGPVVSASFAINRNSEKIKEVNDSKRISEQQRESLFAQLTSDSTARYTVNVTSREVIDEINILQATMESMKNSVAELLSKENGKKAVVLIDGNKIPSGILAACECIVRGDSKEYCIAAASIIAKVTRDRIMIECGKKYPKYGFDEHKGYGTVKHLAAIKEHGPCPEHRKSFKPLRKD
eukprot:CAMPEP_0171453850 /NCGR_PEP_ID=MMETSP0945-20130129/1387_1 /TAXON_ID=109269 /ORGANISM="Vaucheria litorea, Strain CCMP2940" /LENGTH=248 /DNA_ID=CAMNT_0011978787 /DNA_START=74 /DNA_END=820 /DNA_ORIENTATION=+